MEYNKKVFAIVVTYNRKRLLKENLDSLLKQSYSNCDILIIDNNSDDKTRDYISKYLNNPRIHYCNTGKNLGGAGGFNFGIKKAFEYDFDYLWLMDDDCVAKQDALQELIESASFLNDDFGFLVSKTLWIDGTYNVMNIPRTTLSNKMTSSENMVKIKLASFVSFFIKKDVIIDVGLPIADFFIWGDDWEYSNRISKKYNCYYVGKSVVVHKTKSNVGASIATDNSYNLSRYEYLYRNEYILAKNNGLYGILRYLTKIIYNIFKVIVFGDSNKLNKIKIIILSAFSGVFFHPKIEYIGDKSHE